MKTGDRRIARSSDVAREIVCVIWSEIGHAIEVIYLDAEPDHLFGSLDVAALLARDAGLEYVPAPAGTRRWLRNPQFVTKTRPCP